MCGINGFIRTEQEIDNGFSKDKIYDMVHKMNERITHRGPDSEGMFADGSCALGMRRLSIIDLNTGSQPVYNSDHSKLIVFNGEIYNYKGLRDELISEGCVFQTKSDTEVVLKGIEKYGKEFIKKLNGMFAFCIYDRKSRKWLLARDRAGEKPLYYYKNSNFLLFGSELKSLLGTGLINKEIDEEALTTYFQLAYIPAPMSIIKDVRKLMPGTLMEINADGGVYIEQYWKLKVLNGRQYNDYEWCKMQLRDRLRTSVEQRMISDVSLGAFLSGGFDSAIIVGLMSRLSEHPINTFTVGFKEKSYDESELAGIAAKKNGTNHHSFVLDWKEAVEDLDELLDHMDEPFADPSFAASYAVSKITREFVAVALTGDAGDELFAGYNKYLMSYYGEKYKRIPRVFRHGIIEPAVKHMPDGMALYRKAGKVIANAEVPASIQTKRLMCRAFRYDEVERLIPEIRPSKMNFIRNQFDALKDCDDQKRIQYVDFHTVLEGQMLPKVDRSSMKASLETRVPMLDQSVVELAFAMPSAFKIKGRRCKIILKDAFRDLLPDELFKAPKHGLDVPVGIWLTGMLKKELDKYSSKEYLERQGLFCTEFIKNLRKQNQVSNIEWSTKLWSFFVFQHWYEKYMAA